MAAGLRLWLLGGFRVEVDGQPVPERRWRRRKACSLVKLLALAPRHRLHREQLMDALWPDLPPYAAGANLRKAVYFARQTIGAEALRSGEDLHWAASRCWRWSSGSPLAATAPTCWSARPGPSCWNPAADSQPGSRVPRP